MTPDVRAYSEAVANAKRQQEELLAMSQEAERVAQRHAAQRAEQGKRWSEARRELLQALIPALTPEAILRAAELSGYGPLRQPEPILQALERERSSIERRLAAIADDERFTNRELLRDPRVGTLTRRVAELEEYAAEFREVVARCQHPRLERLIETGYGTPSYSVSWWRASYYGDWKAGDEILARFPDKKDFAGVLAEYQQAREVLTVYDADLVEARRQIAEGEALEREHTELSEKLTTLAHRHLLDLRDRTGRFLEDTGLAKVAARLAADPELELLAVRFDGLSRQKEYLAGIARQQEAQVAALSQDLEKARRTLSKWVRPKAAFKPITGETLAKLREPRAERHRKRLQRTWHSHTTVFGFADYQRGRLAPDFLWWDLFTDGRIDGDFVPEVHSFREQHPDYRYDRHHADTAAAAAVAAAAVAGGVAAATMLDDIS